MERNYIVNWKISMDKNTQQIGRSEDVSELNINLLWLSFAANENVGKTVSGSKDALLSN